MRKKSVIIEWTISYIIVLMIPIITIMVNYFYNVNTINEEIYRSNELVLKDLANNMDNYLKEEKNFYAYVWMNNNLRMLATREEKDAWFYNDVSEVYTCIEGYSRWRTQMSCMVYFPDFDHVIGQGANSSYLYYTSMNQSSPRIDYTDWKELIGEDYQNDFLVERFLDGKAGEQCIVYANSYFFAGSKMANIFIAIPISEIVTQMQFLEPETSLVISIDGDCKVAVNCDGVVNLPENVNFAGMAEEIFETDEHMVVAKQSSEKGIVYYMMIPKRDFWKEFQFSRNLFLISLTLTMFVGFICVSKLVKKNFRPLSALHAKITDGIETGNEFQQIENMYNRICDKKNILNSKVMNMTEALQNYYLLSLMKGQILQTQVGGVEMPAFLEAGESVILVGFRVTATESNETGDSELLYFIVNNIFSELMEGEQFYRIEDGKELLFLFRVRETADWKEQCLKKTSYLCDVFEKRGAVLLAAVSGWQDEIKQVRSLYQEVTDALEKKEAVGGSGSIDTQEWLQGNGIVKEILEYIEQHYVESNLNINAIADGINRNPKYISKLFKDETGGSILDYIHSLRIREAQTLLQYGKYSLEEVSDRVGYTNVMTFRRAFVKITGVAPGTYRKD